MLAEREFRSLFLAETISTAGDQIAAVAVAVLVYARTGSPLLAGLGYAATYLPWLLGGPVLSAWAGRFSPRRVLVSCDLIRAVVIGVASLRGVSLPVLAVAVFVTAWLAPPFEAVSGALLPRILDGERYVVASAARQIVHQSLQLGGFVAGGLVVALVGSHSALALDALSFLGSAALLGAGLQDRPAPRRRTPAGQEPGDEPGQEPGQEPGDEPGAELGRRPAREAAREPEPSAVGDALAAARTVARDPRLRRPLLLAMVGAAYVIAPEAVAPAYVAQLGGGPAQVGLVMAAAAGGNVIGALLLGRFVTPATRARAMWPMAILGTVPLLAVVTTPTLGPSLVLFALAGGCSAFQIPARAAFAAAVPEDCAAAVFGTAMTGLYAVQSAAVLGTGALAGQMPAAPAIALIALAGMLCTLRLRPERQDRVGGDGTAGAMLVR